MDGEVGERGEDGEGAMETGAVSVVRGEVLGGAEVREDDSESDVGAQRRRRRPVRRSRRQQLQLTDE